MNTKQIVFKADNIEANMSSENIISLEYYGRAVVMQQKEVVC